MDETLNTSLPSTTTLLNTSIGDILCDVCFNGDVEETNEIVICSLCKTSVHQACYGIVEVPEDNWYCDRCSNLPPEASLEEACCVLCSFYAGALKPIYNKPTFCHISCAHIFRETFFSGGDLLTSVKNVDKIDKRQFNLQCHICLRRKGACVQCEWPKCRNTFHVYCAYMSREAFVFTIDEDPLDLRERNSEARRVFPQANEQEEARYLQHAAEDLPKETKKVKKKEKKEEAYFSVFCGEHAEYIHFKLGKTMNFNWMIMSPKQLRSITKQPKKAPTSDISLKIKGLKEVKRRSFSRPCGVCGFDGGVIKSCFYCACFFHENCYLPVVTNFNYLLDFSYPDIKLKKLLEGNDFNRSNRRPMNNASNYSICDFCVMFVFNKKKKWSNVCSICSKKGGVLKLNLEGDFVHLGCAYLHCEFSIFPFTANLCKPSKPEEFNSNFNNIDNNEQFSNKVSSIEATKETNFNKEQDQKLTFDTLKNNCINNNTLLNDILTKGFVVDIVPKHYRLSSEEGCFNCGGVAAQGALEPCLFCRKNYHAICGAEVGGRFLMFDFNKKTIFILNEQIAIKTIFVQFSIFKPLIFLLCNSCIQYLDIHPKNKAVISLKIQPLIDLSKCLNYDKNRKSFFIKQNSLNSESPNSVPEKITTFKSDKILTSLKRKSNFKHLPSEADVKKIVNSFIDSKGSKSVFSIFSSTLSLFKGDVLYLENLYNFLLKLYISTFCSAYDFSASARLVTKHRAEFSLAKVKSSESLWSSASEYIRPLIQGEEEQLKSFFSTLVSYKYLISKFTYLSPTPFNTTPYSDEQYKTILKRLQTKSLPFKRSLFPSNLPLLNSKTPNLCHCLSCKISSQSFLPSFNPRAFWLSHLHSQRLSLLLLNLSAGLNDPLNLNRLHASRFSSAAQALHFCSVCFSFLRKETDLIIYRCIVCLSSAHKVCVGETDHTFDTSVKEQWICASCLNNSKQYEQSSSNSSRKLYKSVHPRLPGDFDTNANKGCLFCPFEGPVLIETTEGFFGHPLCLLGEGGIQLVDVYSLKFSLGALLAKNTNRTSYVHNKALACFICNQSFGKGQGLACAGEVCNRRAHAFCAYQEGLAFNLASPVTFSCSAEHASVSFRLALKEIGSTEAKLQAFRLLKENRKALFQKYFRFHERLACSCGSFSSQAPEKPFFRDRLSTARALIRKESYKEKTVFSSLVSPGLNKDKDSAKLRRSPLDARFEEPGRASAATRKSPLYSYCTGLRRRKEEAMGWIKNELLDEGFFSRLLVNRPSEPSSARPEKLVEKARAVLGQLPALRAFAGRSSPCTVCFSFVLRSLPTVFGPPLRCLLCGVAVHRECYFYCRESQPLELFGRTAAGGFLFLCDLCSSLLDAPRNAAPLACEACPVRGGAKLLLNGKAIHAACVFWNLDLRALFLDGSYARISRQVRRLEAVSECFVCKDKREGVVVGVTVQCCHGEDIERLLARQNKKINLGSKVLANSRTPCGKRFHVMCGMMVGCSIMYKIMDEGFETMVTYCREHAEELDRPFFLFGKDGEKGQRLVEEVADAKIKLAEMGRKIEEYKKSLE